MDYSQQSFLRNAKLGKFGENVKEKNAVLKKLMKTFDIDSVSVSSTKTKNTMAFKKPQPKAPAKKAYAKPQPKAQPTQGAQSDRHFVGGGWDNSKEYGIFLNLQLNLDKLNELQPDQYGNVKITVAQRKEADERSGMQLMCYHKD